jgi:hypothetical protein
MAMHGGKKISAVVLQPSWPSDSLRAWFLATLKAASRDALPASLSVAHLRNDLAHDIRQDTALLQVENFLLRIQL